MYKRTIVNTIYRMTIAIILNYIVILGLKINVKYSLTYFMIFSYVNYYLIGLILSLPTKDSSDITNA